MHPLALGLVAAPGAPAELADRLAAELPYDVVVERDPAVAAGGSGAELVEVGRARLLTRGWDVAVCLTDGPLRDGRRPVTAMASAMHRVAVVSTIDVDRARALVVEMVGELLPPASRQAGAPAYPVLRANRPWSLAARLTRALAGALAAIVFALVNGEVWRLSDALGWPRLAGLTVVSAALTGAALIAAHDLWERGPRRAVAQFNRATVLTVAIGVLTLQAALFVSAVAAAALLVHADVLAHGLRHPAELGDYLALAWLASSIAMIGGALGVALESDDAVRHAAYRYTTRGP
jgi:hypothetical protein